MSESAAVANVLVECTHLSPGLYRHVDTGDMIEVRKPKTRSNGLGMSVPGIRFGRAVRNAPGAFIGLLNPLDEAGQMLIATMLKHYDDI
jgi:hypothetical protein